MPNKKRESTDQGGRPRLSPEPTGLFANWLRDSGKTVGQVAEDLEIAASSVYGLKDGAFSPGLKLAAKIERYTDGAVPALSWTEGD